VTPRIRAYDRGMRRFLLVLCLAATPTFAQEEEEPKDKEEAPASTEDQRKRWTEEGEVHLNPEGKYGGVAPGAQNLPPKAPKLPLRKGPQRLTWSGFQVKDGVPTVFLETTGTPDYHVAAHGDGLVVTLRNTVVPVKNNRRPLRVEAFNTGVKAVETTTHGKETRVLIHMKEPMQHKERVEPAAGGFQMLLIELGK
jgi:hypothetical protein